MQKMIKAYIESFPKVLMTSYYQILADIEYNKNSDDIVNYIENNEDIKNGAVHNHPGVLL